MVGIYRITSPSSKVYIGQSWNIPKRFISYRYTRNQRGLINSFKKYGVPNHRFEIVHELPDDVEQSIMNGYEQLYMDVYRDAGIKLLNCKEAGSTGKMCETTKHLITKALIGRKNSEATKRKRALSLIGRPVSDRQKQKMREAMTGRTLTKEHRENVSKGGKGKKRTIATRKAISDGRKGMKLTDEHKKNVSKSRKEMGIARGGNNPKAKLTETQVIEIREKLSQGVRQIDLSKEYGVGRNTICDIAKGRKWKHLLPLT